MSERTMVEVAFFTDDVEALKRFYRDMLGSAPVAQWPSGAIFAVGDAKLLVHERADAMDGGPPNEDHVALGVGDLNRTCRALRDLGLSFLVEPQDFPWGRSAYLRDPDGRLVELSQS